MILRRFALLAMMVTLAYLAMSQMGPLGWALQDTMTPPTADSGYSAYTMYERCHMDDKGVMQSHYTHRQGC